MFRFTIRDVLWLMVVVGMGVGWWAKWSDGEKHRKATLAVEGHFINTVRTWAKEKGEDIQFYTGRHYCMAHSNGVVAIMGEGELP